MDIIEHRVRERAYYIWEAEGRVAGRADAHWIQAEVEIAAATASKAPRAKAAVKAAPKTTAKAPAKAPVKAPAKAKKPARSVETGAALH